MDGSTKFWIGFGLFFAVLLIVGQGLLVVGAGSSTSRAAVGDCFAITDVGGSAGSNPDLSKVEARTVDCARKDAVYRVALRLSNTTASCPTDSYTPYLESGIGKDFKLCLGYNVATGECFEESEQLRSKITCTSSPGEGRIKVLKVVEGVAAESACDSLHRSDVFAGVYPVPAPRTVCFTALGGRGAAGTKT
jgi:hypothetical protein